MTENQRNYLADLAGRKGVRLFNTDDWSVAKASDEIERLKELPDANFEQITTSQIKRIDSLTKKTLNGLHEWGFTNG